MAVSPAVAQEQAAEPSTPSQEELTEADSQAMERLPLLSQMELPTDEQLLHGPRRDWVVLRNERVIVTEPLTPRPSTLEAMRQAIEQKRARRAGLTGLELEQFRKEFNALHEIKLHLPDQEDEADYVLHIDDVSQVLLHEDLMLLRVDELTKKGELALAYEYLNTLRRQHSDWPGAAERHQAMLLAEADRRIRNDDYESALAILEETHERQPGLFGLSERAGNVVDHLLSRAIRQQDWRQVRYFVGRLRAMFPGHPVVTGTESDLRSRAERQLALAQQAQARGEHAAAAELAEQAAFLWPATRNLRSRIRPYAERYQRLHVGVMVPPRDELNTFVMHTASANRHRRLTELTFFEEDRSFDGGAHYRTRFCERWEPLNLGRRVLFELRTGRQPWESHPIITAPEVTAALAERLDPTDPAYDERLASYTNSIVVHSPYSFSILFDHVPVKAEALLQFPLQTRQAESSAQSPVSSDAGPTVTGHSTLDTQLQPAELFTLAGQSPGRSEFDRVHSEPDGLSQYHVGEIHEHAYGTYEEALSALERGDVSVLPHLPAWQIDRVRDDEDFLRSYFVQKMTLPTTHVLQFHPRSQPLKIREYRRALAYALDRAKILTETVMRGARGNLGRVVEGPFPAESYANSALVRRRDYDPMAAIALALAARQQLGAQELPPLKMIVPTEPVVRAAAEQLIRSWARIGITARIIDPPAGPLLGDAGGEPQWDLVYRTVQLSEPVTQLWPFLTMSRRARVADLDEFPDWLRQEIVELDRLSDWSAAVQATKQLHVHLWAEMHLIPLWEVDEYLIYRKNIRGVPPVPVHPYDRVDRWIVETWYPTDT